MITKVQLDSAIGKMESKLDSHLNAKIEALKENFNAQIKTLENKSSLDGLGVASGEDENVLNYEKLEEKVNLLDSRVSALEEILKGLISSEE